MDIENVNTTTGLPKEASQTNAYIARQPIFNSTGQVQAYELLYRDADRSHSTASQIGDEEATGTVLAESILNFGLSELTNGKKAFVNFAEGHLLNEAAYLLNPEQFVIEILETVVFTVEVIDSLYTLKAAGFDIALDDYIGTDIPEEILSLIDIIKIDFKDTTKELRAAFAPVLIDAGKILLAEKVETKEDVLEAMSLGCQLFQGYYFSKPVTMKKNRMDISSVSYVKLSKEIASPVIDMERIAWIINWDAHLTYSLLKRMKTLQYYRGNTINSIKHSLIMMGNEEVRRWIMLILIRGVVSTKSDELIRTALIRAFMCEKLAKESGNHKYVNDAFSTGMFSILMTSDNTAADALGDIQLPENILAALSGTDNLLKRFLDVTLCYENGMWVKLEYLASYTLPGISMRILPGLYLLSVAEADEMLCKEDEE